MLKHKHFSLPLFARALLRKKRQLVSLAFFQHWIQPKAIKFRKLLFKYQNFLKNYFKYQPCGAGGIRTPPTRLHRLQKQIGPQGGSKMKNRFWKGVYSWFSGTPINSRKVSFFSTPSLKKVEAGERKKFGKEGDKNIGEKRKSRWK